MVETRDYEGYLWLPKDGGESLPADASKRLAGKLTIERGRAELALLGNFGHKVFRKSDEQTVYSPLPSDVPRVLGLTSDGKRVTLDKCTVIASRMSWPGITTATYRADVALVGVWFLENEPIVFDEFALRTTEMDTWVGVSGLTQSIHGAEGDGERKFNLSAIDIRFEPPESITIPLDDGEEVRITFGYTSLAMERVPVTAGISQRSFLHFRYAAPRSVYEIPASVAKLRNFLTLGVGKPVTVLSVTGYRDDYIHPATNIREPVELLWHIPHNSVPAGRKVEPFEMLFRLGDSEPGISQLLRSWLARQDLFKPVVDLYFAMLYHPDIFAEVRFLLYAQAIETYDFRRRDPWELPPKEHRRRVKALLEQVPEGWYEWLRPKLLNNYRVLDERIRDVLDECPTVSAKIVGNSQEEVEEFVRLFKRTRNYYTHYTPELEEKAATQPAARHLLAVQLRAMLEMSLLRELGFGEEAIDEILERVERYLEIQHFRAAAREEETQA
jgi:hypothetical protein